MELIDIQKTIIKALVENLNNGPVGQEAIEEYFEISELECERIKKIIKSLTQS